MPSELVERIDALVREGFARSRGELLAEAIRHELRRIERDRIDAQIREMAHDEAAMSDNRAVQDDFEHADREAWSKIPR